MKEKELIVAFHIGRGGRFNNPGFVKYVGEKSIGDFTEDLFLRYENEREIADRLKDSEEFTGKVDRFFDLCTDQDTEAIEEEFGVTEEDLGGLVYEDCGGNLVELTQAEVEDGIGVINMDHSYDTTYSKYIEDCSEQEIELIIKSGSLHSQDLQEYIESEWEFLLEENTYQYFVDIMDRETGDVTEVESGEVLARTVRSANKFAEKETNERFEGSNYYLWEITENDIV